MRFIAMLALTAAVAVRLAAQTTGVEDGKRPGGRLAST